MEVNLVDPSSHQLIKLESLLPLGYETKHAVLHKAGDFNNAADTLERMLSKIAESPDLVIRHELYLCHHGKDDLFTLFDKAWRQAHQPIEQTGNDSQSHSTDHRSFATCAHQHDHQSSLQ